MWTPTAPVYIVSVNNTPEVAKKLVAILIQAGKPKYLKSLGLTAAGFDNPVQSGSSSKYRQ